MYVLVIQDWPKKSGVIAKIGYGAPPPLAKWFEDLGGSAIVPDDFDEVDRDEDGADDLNREGLE